MSEDHHVFMQSAGKAFIQSQGKARQTHYEMPQYIEYSVPFNISKSIGHVSENITDVFKANINNELLKPEESTVEVGIIDDENLFPFTVLATARWSKIEDTQIFYNKSYFILSQNDFDSTAGANSLGDFDIKYSPVHLLLSKDTATFSEDSKYLNFDIYSLYAAHRKEGGYYWIKYFWEGCVPWSEADTPAVDSPQKNSFASPLYYLNAIELKAEFRSGGKERKYLGEMNVCTSKTSISKKAACNINASPPMNLNTNAYYLRAGLFSSEKVVETTNKDSWLTNRYIEYTASENTKNLSCHNNTFSTEKIFSNIFKNISDSTLMIAFSISSDKLSALKGTVTVYLDSTKTEYSFFGYCSSTTAYSFSKNVNISKTVSQIKVTVSGLGVSALQKMNFGFKTFSELTGNNHECMSFAKYSNWKVYHSPYTNDISFIPQEVPYNYSQNPYEEPHSLLNVSVGFSDAFKSFWTNNFELLFDDKYIPYQLPFGHPFYVCNNTAYIRRSQYPIRFNAAFCVFGNINQNSRPELVNNVSFQNRNTPNRYSTGPLLYCHISTQGCFSLLTSENNLNLNISPLHIKLQN